ncbi:DUF4270 domain-containing protein [Aquimarina brevivitae]|uniref:DUF4270 domain-containing protein n=1 Tax=Aquimarina brevivitae TaxID=323412 RepID=UPI0013EE7138|nr:DUF4270 domain-containing protein [Aquimarina brevivitae]
MKNRIVKAVVCFTIALTAISCNDDFNTVGDEIIGDVNFQNDSYIAYPTAVTKKLSAVQATNLPCNMLGIYVDPVYGKTEYSLLSQIEPPNYNPVFGENPVLDKVILSIPYYSELISTETNENEEIVNTYELDSVYGESTINLRIYRSNYFLSDFNPSMPEERKIYYSNDISTFSSLEGQLLADTLDFKPSAEEVLVEIDDDNDEDTPPQIQRLPPQLRIEFSEEIVNYFKQEIIDKEGQPELSNANNFRNYFRGIYIKTESASAGNMFKFDISEATITLQYTTDIRDIEDTNNDGSTDDTVRGQQEYVFSFTNNVINAISNTLNPDIEATYGPEEQGEISGEENIYLKGGEGSYGVLEFFNEPAFDENGDPVFNEEGEQITELEYLRNQEWLINEANLKIYVDQDKMVSGSNEPERIFIFNENTGSVLIDYFDGTNNESNPINSITNHLERLSRDADENGEFYKIRLTRHIIDVLNRDEDNVKLGIAVSQNVNITGLANGFNTPADEADRRIPFSSIVSHEGTILHGPGANVPESKRVKLEIFYTK